jgi:hypothetical protein
MAGSGITLQISTQHAQFLGRYGARSQRGRRGTFSRSVVLARLLDSFRLYQTFNDPRQTHAFPEPYFALIARHLPEPWLLRKVEIEHLEDVLETAPDLAPAATAQGIDLSTLLAAVTALPPAEKLTLVNHAILHQAPAAAAASAALDEP